MLRAREIFIVCAATTIIWYKNVYVCVSVFVCLYIKIFECLNVCCAAFKICYSMFVFVFGFAFCVCVSILDAVVLGAYIKKPNKKTFFLFVNFFVSMWCMYFYRLLLYIYIWIYFRFFLFTNCLQKYCEMYTMYIIRKSGCFVFILNIKVSNFAFQFSLL